MRVLLAEDDAMIGEALALSLKEAAYAVDWVRSGDDALFALETQEYDLVLLDLGLPGKDGFTVLRRFRERGGDAPALILTARDAVEDRIKGLDLGADDYLVKPFETAELLARMRAVIRRGSGFPVSQLENGPMRLDINTREFFCNGRSDVLSAREFSLMQALLMRPGAVLSRDRLEEAVYGWNEEVESNAVEVIIHSVRKKFGADAIKNVRGVGWLVSKSAK